MRILIIHNRYQDPGGEDLVVQQESNLLAQSNTVKTYIVRNQKGFAGFLQFLAYPFNRAQCRKLENTIRQFNPDIVHVHNLHYALGPLFIRFLHKRQIPVVMTLHNYRLVCPSATLFHQNSLFTSSIQATFPWKAIWAGVHQGSILKTFWIALTYYLHRRQGTWQKVNRYLVLTPFAKEIFKHSAINISEEKLIVKPNFILDIAKNQNLSQRENFFLFVGRLSQEKGIKTLINAFEKNGETLYIAGDGPLKAYVTQKCASNTNLHFLGRLKNEEVRTQMQACNALIFPSEWYEGMPMTIIEAFATGTAVIASNLGAMAAMVGDEKEGILFEAGNADDLGNCVDKWNKMDENSKTKIREQARNSYQQHYTAEANKQLLLDIYNSLNTKL